LTNKKTILLTFDLEEFDLPQERGIAISKERQLDVALEGLRTVLRLLKETEINVTFFTTAYFASQFPEMIKQMSESHEIASHMYFHSDDDVDHVQTSHTELSRLTNQSIAGFRMPRFASMSLMEVKKAGYQYDSSLNPTFIPNRYNNFFRPRKIHRDPSTELTIVPMSVTPIFRFPLFWLSFKNINYYLYLFMCKWCLWNDDYLHLYFHPWEFANLNEWKIPNYIKSPSGNELINRLQRLITDLKKKHNFSTIISYLRSIKKIN
jgi:peptidoglycan/xylan/chitin deacetylase (PgdA/CDA1 family)